jgi:serine/threonine protein kinase
MPDLPLVGTDFAGYLLRSVLGRGGMSIVYQAENPRLRNLIALKVLAPDLASDEVFRTRFREESQIAASLNHPNVIPIHDFGDYNGLLYIAMRYVPGTDLGRLIADYGWLAPGAAVYLLEQAARALDAAHARGLVHRDVKPGNLLIAQGGERGDPDHVYLADFGITKYMGARTGLTQAGTVLGTVHYVSPEQIQEQTVFGAADQYSLGCVLYECLTGRAPFERSTNEMVMWAHVNEPPVLATTLRPDLPPAIDEVFARVLAKNPADRYASCREFIADARGAIAPSQAFQSAPVVSGGFSGLAHPTIRDQRTPPANAAVPGPPTDPRDSRQPPFPGHFGYARDSSGFRDFRDFRGEVDFGAPPARPRRVRRRRSHHPDARSVASLTAIGAAVAVIAAGGAAAGLFFSKTASDTPASALYQALEGTEHFTDRLPLSTCAQRSPTNVVCTNPDPAISSVSFVKYPSLSALYTKYQEDVRNVAGEPFSSLTNKGAMCSMTAPDPTGENTWNHTDVYTHQYTVHQMAAGKVSDIAAMGRVFCDQTSTGSEIIIWTQDSGRVLGYATGAASHEQVWNWFYPIHHSIIFDGQYAMPGMETPASAATSPPR